MIMEAITCPHCGGDLSEYRKNTVQMCPYCKRPIYAKEEGGHFTYTEEYIKEDRARLREAEVKENIRSQELEFEREKFRDQKKREEDIQAKKEKTSRWKFKLIIFLVVIIAFILQHIILNILAERREESAYEQALVEQNTPQETVYQTEEITVSQSTLQAAISSASELVAYKYFYTNLGVSEKEKKLFNKYKVPFSKDKTIFTYDGVISAGYDLKSLEIEVVDKDKKIIITMPKARILSHDVDLDSFQTYDVKNSIFTSISIDEYSDFVAALKKDREEKLKNNEEFWNQVERNAETAIKELLTATGETANYAITFK